MAGVRTRVANLCRCNFKALSLVKICGKFYGHLVYYWLFGIFCGRLVYFVVIWHIFSQKIGKNRGKL
jgi:hypothetical protein